MSVCQLVLMDAAYNTGRFDEGRELYDQKDLENAMQFAEWLVEEGETFMGAIELDPSKFLEWAKKKMKEEGWQ